MTSIHTCDTATIRARFIAAVEAQMLMGHVPANRTICPDGTVLDWSWDSDQVRQALYVPRDSLWQERVFVLEATGLAQFSVYCAPLEYDDDGQEIGEIPGWRDEPREKWGSLSITGEGVLRLATQYSRPYVKLAKSPAVLAHWTLVQEETAQRIRSMGPETEERLTEEWPERTWYGLGRALSEAAKDTPWCPLCKQWRDDSGWAAED